MRKSYILRPLSHGLEAHAPSLNKSIGVAEWPSQNFKVDQRSLKKRAGYIEDRDFGDGVDLQNIIHFQNSAGTISTVVLTDTNACKRESSGTWSYLTEKYSTGTISSISNVTVTGSSTGWDTGSNNPAAGDYFIMDADLSASDEPDIHWTKILSVGSDTAITLESGYEGATSSGNYTIRQVYSVPTNERWTWAIVEDYLYFTNGAINLQRYSGSGNASEVDSTYGVKARYCLEYCDRLLLADLYRTGTRYPSRVQWSKNNDPTDWTDATAGANDLTDTEDIITGMSKVGNNLIVLKSNSIVIGTRTGKSTAPILFNRERIGIGTPAPYSVVNVEGCCAFVGRNDFYVVEDDYPIAIGEKVRHDFFNRINATEIKRTSGYVNTAQKEVRWFATGDDNIRRCYVWDYKDKEFYMYKYAHAMSVGGKGELD